MGPPHKPTNDLRSYMRSYDMMIILATNCCVDIFPHASNCRAPQPQQFSQQTHRGKTRYSIAEQAMSGKPWSGEQELLAALNDLCGQHPVAASKIRQAVTVANKYCQEFKMVVYEIEKFVKKSPVDDKIAGVFVMDSLCRQHSKERESFAKRFAIRLKDTMSHLSKVSSKDLSVVSRFLEEWRKKDVFPVSTLQTIVSCLGLSDGAGSSSQSSFGRESATDDFILASQITGQPVVDEAISSLVPAPRLCPFRDGCPFGDKCRFSHASGAVTLPSYLLRLPIGIESGDRTQASKRRRVAHEEVTAALARLTEEFDDPASPSAPLFKRVEIAADCVIPAPDQVQCFEVPAAAFHLVHS